MNDERILKYDCGMNISGIYVASRGKKKPAR
jgi:hypothetical protein